MVICAKTVGLKLPERGGERAVQPNGPMSLGCLTMYVMACTACKLAVFVFNVSKLIGKSPAMTM